MGPARSGKLVGEKRRVRHGEGAGSGRTEGTAAAAELEDVGDQDDAARKMREVVRKQRKMMLGAGGADEFNLA